MTQNWTPEPWNRDTHKVYEGPDSDREVRIRDYERAFACVNALAGIADPAAFVTRAKAIEEAASNAVPMMQMAWKQYGVGGMFECMDALRAALAKIGGGA